MWLLFEGSIWLAVLFERRQGKDRSGLGYSGRLMARAAVKAKQQAAAKAQPPKARAARHGGSTAAAATRTRSSSSSGCGATRSGCTPCSPSSSRSASSSSASAPAAAAACSQLYNGIFGGSGGSSVSKAQDEIKTDPGEGIPRPRHRVRDEQSNPGQAITALQNYLEMKKKDAATWARARRPRADAGEQVRDAVPAARSRRLSPRTRARRSCPAARSGRRSARTRPTASVARQRRAETSPLYQKATPRSAPPSPTTRRRRSSGRSSTTYPQELAQRGAATPATARSRSRRCSRYLKLDPNAPLKKQIKRRSSSSRLRQDADRELETAAATARRLRLRPRG